MEINGKISFTNGKFIKFKYRLDNVSPANYKISLHTHDYCEMCIFVRGNMRHIVESSTYELEEGDIFICRDNELHHGISISESCYERYVFYFPSDIFDHLSKGRNQLLPFLRADNSKNHNLIKPDENTKLELFDILKKVRTMFENHPMSYEAQAYSYIIRIFSLIGNLYRSSGYIAHQRYIPLHIEKALDYINNNFSTLSGISEISDYLHINPQYLARSFKRYMGVSITYYITNKRISKSKEILHGDANVTDACFASGFNSTSYYIKIFRDMVGKTPAQYKRDVLNDHTSKK